MSVVHGREVDGQFFGIAVSWHYGSEIGGTVRDVLHGWVCGQRPWDSVTGVPARARAASVRTCFKRAWTTRLAAEQHTYMRAPAVSECTAV